MNIENLKLEIARKEKEIQCRKENTKLLFELIKDDCVDIVTRKQMDCNFEHSSMLHSTEILSLIFKKKGLDMTCADLDIIYYPFGIEDSVIIIEPTALCRQIPIEKSYSDERTESRVREFNRDSREKRQVLSEFKNSIDAPLLMTSLRNYIISKGFDGKSRNYSFTGKKYNVMEFETTKHRLLNPSLISRRVIEIIFGIIIFSIIVYLNK